MFMAMMPVTAVMIPVANVALVRMRWSCSGHNHTARQQSEISQLQTQKAHLGCYLYELISMVIKLDVDEVLCIIDSFIQGLQPVPCVVDLHEVRLHQVFHLFQCERCESAVQK